MFSLPPSPPSPQSPLSHLSATQSTNHYIIHGRTYHVCAEGSRPGTGAWEIVNFGLSSENPSEGNCDEPVTNWRILVQQRRDTQCVHNECK